MQFGWDTITGNRRRKFKLFAKPSWQKILSEKLTRYLRNKGGKDSDLHGDGL